MLASDLALIPTQCEYLSMNGVSHVVNMVKMVKDKVAHNLDYRILATLYDPGNTAEKLIYDKLASQYMGKMLRTTIERDGKIQESQIAHLPILSYDRQSPAGRQYMKLAGELFFAD